MITEVVIVMVVTEEIGEDNPHRTVVGGTNQIHLNGCIIEVISPYNYQLISGNKI